MTIEVENGTLCPNCKKKALVEARTRENNPAIDGMKCKNCDSLYRWNESHHLEPVAANVTPATHTAALIKTAPVKPETMVQAVVIAEKSLIRTVTEPAPAGRKSRNMGGWKLSAEMIEDIKKRLKAGEAVSVLACEYKVTPEAIYPYRRQLGIHGKNGKKAEPAAPPAPSQVKSEPPSIDPKKKPAQVHNNMNGNVMSQMARLRRGEIRTRAARPVLSRYKQMLEGELKVKQGEVKELKQKISVADDALNALEIIEKGEKDIIDKVLVAVRG